MIQYTEQSQMQQANTINYGATGHVANNPFAMAGGLNTTIAEESVQPDTTLTDNYSTYDYTQTAPSTLPQPPQQQMGQMPSYEQQYPQPYQQQ